LYPETNALYNQNVRACQGLFEPNSSFFFPARAVFANLRFFYLLSSSLRQSLKKRSTPISVRGCRASCIITLNGIVQNQLPTQLQPERAADV
jgi:hypothetical protein